MHRGFWRDKPVAVICTALPIEYRAVREHLDGSLVEQEERGTLYEVGTFAGELDTWEVVLVETGAGNTSAGVELERAISVFAPEVVFFVGVAGGRKDVDLGDVVIANWVYDYESGKDTEYGYIPRTRSYASAHRLVQRSNAIVRRGEWSRRIRGDNDGNGGDNGGDNGEENGHGNDPGTAPVAIVKPVVAGAKVIAHRGSQVAELLDRYCDDAVAVEMEGHGFLYGAYVNSGVDALIVRGISDLLSGKNGEDDRYWQPVAAGHAAAFAFEVLNRLRGSEIEAATAPIARRRALAGRRDWWSHLTVWMVAVVACVALLPSASAPAAGLDPPPVLQPVPASAEFSYPTVIETGHNGVQGVAEIVYDPDGNFVVTSGNEALTATTRIWDVDSYELVRELPDAGVPTAISPSGRFLVTGARDAKVRFWDLTTFDSQGPLRADNLTALVFRPDTDKVIGGNRSGRLQEWNSSTPSLSRSDTVQCWIEAIAVNPSGELVAGCVEQVSGDSQVVVRNATTDEVIARLEHLHRPVALSSDATLLIGGAAMNRVGYPRELQFWDLTRMRQLATMPSPESTRTYVPPAIHADGELVAVPQKREVHLVRVTDSGVEPVARLTGVRRGEVTSVAFSPDGQTLAAGDNQGRVRFWDLSALTG